MDRDDAGAAGEEVEGLRRNRGAGFEDRRLGPDDHPAIARPSPNEAQQTSRHRPIWLNAECARPDGRCFGTAVPLAARTHPVCTRLAMPLGANRRLSGPDFAVFYPVTRDGSRSNASRVRRRDAITAAYGRVPNRCTPYELVGTHQVRRSAEAFWRPTAGIDARW